jgi:2-polyprenyl-3-methyl-5-hydroxy-6-metoxy-1,4-benzoquinol methylase
VTVAAAGPAVGIAEPLPTVPLVRCPLCGASDFRPLPFAYEYEGATFPGGACRRCGLRGLLVQPAAHAFGRLYARGYFEGGDVRCGHVGDYFADRAAQLRDGAALAERFERVNGGRAGRLLELGCASGAVLEAAANRGWAVHGVEYSADAAAEAERHGVPVTVGGLEDARRTDPRLADASFDVAFLGDVLEHVPDPAATLSAVHAVLAPGGALVLRGPMATHSFARTAAMAAMTALGRTWRLAEPPYHLWEFTPGPLTALVRRAGFQIETFRQTKIPPTLAKRRTGAGRALAVPLYALDATNAAWTALTHTRGDRCELVARRGAES